MNPYSDRRYRRARARPVIGSAAMAQQVSLATGGVAGVYFPLGGAMAEAWSAEIDGLTVTAESTGASVVNVRLIEGGEAEFAMVQNDIAFTPSMATRCSRAMRSTRISALPCSIPRSSRSSRCRRGISTVDDLSGQRVAVGAPGSGTEANARQILQAHGISYDDITSSSCPSARRSTRCATAIDRRRLPDGRHSDRRRHRPRRHA
jgi:uncharacterized protein